VFRQSEFGNVFEPTKKVTMNDTPKKERPKPQVRVSTNSGYKKGERTIDIVETKSTAVDRSVGGVIGGIAALVFML